MMAGVCRTCDAPYSNKGLVISEASEACDSLGSNGLAIRSVVETVTSHVETVMASSESNPYSLIFPTCC